MTTLSFAKLNEYRIGNRLPSQTSALFHGCSARLLKMFLKNHLQCLMFRKKHLLLQPKCPNATKGIGAATSYPIVAGNE